MEIEKAQKEIEGKHGDDLKHKKVGKEAGDLADEVDRITSKGNVTNDETGLKELAERNLRMCKNLLELSKNIESMAQKILDNGEGLREKKKFKKDVKPLFDVVGKKVEEAGDILMGMKGKIEEIGKRWVRIGELVAKDKSKDIIVPGKELQGLANKISDYGMRVKAIGNLIQKLQINKEENVTTPKPVVDNGNAKDLEQIQQDLGDIAKLLEGMVKVSY